MFLFCVIEFLRFVPPRAKIFGVEHRQPLVLENANKQTNTVAHSQGKQTNKQTPSTVSIPVAPQLASCRSFAHKINPQSILSCTFGFFFVLSFDPTSVQETASRKTHKFTDLATQNGFIPLFSAGFHNFFISFCFVRFHKLI